MIGSFIFGAKVQKSRKQKKVCIKGNGNKKELHNQYCTEVRENLLTLVTENRTESILHWLQGNRIQASGWIRICVITGAVVLGSNPKLVAEVIIAHLVVIW